MKNAGELVDRYGYIAYPILLAIFPLLSFYGSNSADLRTEDSQLGTFIIFNLTVLAFAWSISYLAIRNRKKASLMAVAFLVVFFSFGRLHSQFHDISIGTPITPLGPTKILIILSVVFLSLAWFGIRKLSEKTTKTIGLALTIVSSYLLFSSLFSIVLPRLNNDQDQVVTNASAGQEEVADAQQSKPDVYYILLDGYGRADYLKSAFNYDNSDFINGLKDRGFFVADKSNANYAHTHLSVPSTFNMKYLNYLTDEVGEESNNRKPLQELTQYNDVVMKFKDTGYKYINIGTQWGWSKSSPIDDIEPVAENKTDSKLLGINLNEAAVVYLQTTALKPWIQSELRSTMVGQVTDAIEKTKKVPAIPEPTLTFTHFLLPHPPYLFDSNGVIKGQSQVELDNHGFSDKEKFVQQSIYTNKIALDLADYIIKNSDKPPIIIIASDHGPASNLSPSEFQETDPAKLDKAGVQERMAILNAYYFPDEDYSKLYPGISPVNTFRVILSQYYGKDLEILPDQSYMSDNKENQYKFTDVTELVNN